MKSKLTRALLAILAAFVLAFVAGTVVGYLGAPSKAYQARLLVRQMVMVRPSDEGCVLWIELPHGRVYTFIDGAVQVTTGHITKEGHRCLQPGLILEWWPEAVPWTGSDFGTWRKYVEVIPLLLPPPHKLQDFIASIAGDMFGMSFGRWLSPKVDESSPEVVALLESVDEWRYLARDAWLLVVLQIRDRQMRQLWKPEDWTLLMRAQNEDYVPTPEELCQLVNLVLDERDYRTRISNYELRMLLEEIESLGIGQ